MEQTLAKGLFRDPSLKSVLRLFDNADNRQTQQKQISPYDNLTYPTQYPKQYADTFVLIREYVVILRVRQIRAYDDTNPITA